MASSALAPSSVRPAPSVALPEVAPPGSKLLDLQSLRALAASLVAADHITGALTATGISAVRFSRGGHLVGHIGVIAFFVLSGLIMVRQSSSLFGAPSGPLHFAYRRIIRIVPMYWIAVLIWAATPFHRSTPHAAKQLFMALAFIPNYLSPVEGLLPILPLGWTLNYEMSFYFLFFLALCFTRRNGILLLFFIPQVLVTLGHSGLFPGTSPLVEIFKFYCNPIILSFVFGVILGYVEFNGPAPTRLRLPISPAWLLILPGFLFMARPDTIGQTQEWELVGLYAVLVVVACVVFPTLHHGPIQRAVVRLGDASYSTYLFHLFAYPPIVLVLGKLWGHQPANRLLMIVATLAAVVGANLLGLLIHLYIERPLTSVIRKIPVSFLKTLDSRPA